eukprot:TRINITY_DN13173_c0_g1_i2.p3 TRINITY_DN13173_c0_g1~~TRINITY_DN13173_c0_g1_i2.p3  ORF type:complete len:226 (+),score=95.34 TRINITY_DN13173_c0_g1_i2:852-1529(+)
MAVVSDMREIVRYYARFMRPVFRRESGILADMYAYTMAAAHLRLAHVQVDNLMVSTLEGSGEGWKWIDEWPGEMSCDAPAVPVGHAVPTFLHGCQNYKALDGDGNEWMWHKGHVPHNILGCDTPLLKQPPDNLFNVQTLRERRRGAFMVCVLHARLNAAATELKRRHCPGGFNVEKRVRLVQKKRLSCSDERLCWPLAQLEEPLPSDAALSKPSARKVNGRLSRN